MRLFYVKYPQDRMGDNNFEILTEEQLRKECSKESVSYMNIRELSPRLEGQALEELQIGSEYTPRTFRTAR